jgi:hypothetical protein
MATDQSKLPPPYMSWGVFKTIVDTLAEATVPTGPLDRRVLDKLSGADHGALMSGLRFLGYVDEDRRATNEYRKLIAASKEPLKFKELLTETISAKYDPIIGSVDMEFGTAAEVEKAFRDYGVPVGQMLTKTIRFYIKALQEIGVSVSQHITKPKPRTPRNGAKKTTKLAGKGARGTATHTPQEHSAVPRGFDRMPVPGLPNAFIQFPLDLTPEQVDLFGAVVNVLRTFAKGKSGKGEENQ